MATNDGGPAFPRPASQGRTNPTFPEDWTEQAQTGLSLRDWFASQALIGFLSFPESRDGCPAEAFAKAAFEQADAMLKARES